MKFNTLTTITTLVALALGSVAFAQDVNKSQATPNSAVQDSKQNATLPSVSLTDETITANGFILGFDPILEPKLLGQPQESIVNQKVSRGDFVTLPVQSPNHFGFIEKIIIVYKGTGEVQISANSNSKGVLHKNKWGKKSAEILVNEYTRSLEFRHLNGPAVKIQKIIILPLAPRSLCFDPYRRNFPSRVPSPCGGSPCDDSFPPYVGPIMSDNLIGIVSQIELVTRWVGKNQTGTEYESTLQKLEIAAFELKSVMISRGPNHTETTQQKLNLSKAYHAQKEILENLRRTNARASVNQLIQLMNVFQRITGLN